MKVSIVPFREDWLRDFVTHRARIFHALADFKPVVEHIGSTSVPGMIAKPIIDVLVGIGDPSRLDCVIQPMRRAGYCYVEKFTSEMPQRRFFCELVALGGATVPDFIGRSDSLEFGRRYESVANIHVMAEGGSAWIRHLAFRDYLLETPEARSAYNKLKHELSLRDYESPLDYNDLKSEFVTRWQEKALRWYKSRGLAA